VKSTVMKFVALAVLFAGFATYASADSIWTINASFVYPSNGNTNTETGTFRLDPSLNLVTWDITVSGTNTLADNVYTPGDSFRTLPEDPTHLDLYDGGSGTYIDLYFAAPLTNAGGTITLLAGNNGANFDSTIVCDGCGVLDTTEINTVIGSTVVPEPSGLMLLGSGFVGLLGVVRRKLRV